MDEFWKWFEDQYTSFDIYYDDKYHIFVEEYEIKNYKQMLIGYMMEYLYEVNTNSLEAILEMGVNASVDQFYKNLKTLIEVI